MPETWAKVSARLGRNDFPAALVHAVIDGRLTDPAEIRIGFEAAWTMCEWPGMVMEREIWLALLERGHIDLREMYMHETLPRLAEYLPEEMVLYRGANEQNMLGLSWTTSFERAHWFATRMGAFAPGAHHVYKLTATRDIIVAHFNESRSSEEEWLVDTTNLWEDDIEVIPPSQYEALLNA